MGFLENIGFIRDLAAWLGLDYWETFAVFGAASVFLLSLIILLIVTLVKRRRARALRRAGESGRKEVGGVTYPRDMSAETEPLLPMKPVPPAAPARRVSREIESSYKGLGGGLVPVKPDIDDESLLEIIYSEIVSKRENISRSAFFSDRNFAQAQLEYVKERLVRLQLRGMTTREALNMYLGKTPLIKFRRREYHVLSELERQTIKQQKDRALEADIQTLMLHVTALEKTIEDLNDKIKSSKNRKQNAETRKKIAEYYKELDVTRQQLALMREKEAEDENADKPAEQSAAAPASPVSASAPAVSASPAPSYPAQPVIIQTAPQPVLQPLVIHAASPSPLQPPAPVQYIDYALRAELTAELKALILLVNETQGLIKDLEFKNAASAISREHIRGEINKVNTAALKASTREELGRYSSDAQLLNNELNSVVLDMEICAGDKAQMTSDVYNAHTRINDIIQKLGLTYQDVTAVEKEILSGNRGVMNDGATAAWNLAEAKRRAEAAKQDMRSYIAAEQARPFSFEQPAPAPQNAVKTSAESSGLSQMEELRKEYMQRMREMEEERIAFYRDFAKASLQNQSAQPPVQQIKSNSIVPPDYVLVRKADGSLVMMHRSRLPKNVKPAGAAAPKAKGGDAELRIIKRLPGGSVIRSDGSMLRADGKVLRPKKAKDAETLDYREILMKERRELLAQRKAMQDAELLSKIENSLREAGSAPLPGEHPLSEDIAAGEVSGVSIKKPKTVKAVSDPLEEEITKIENALKTGKKEGNSRS